MEKFCRHIEKLLAHHDFVVVPGLGGFVVQMQSAQIQPDYITPPFASIGFNPLMNNSDGLLAIEISRSEKISYRLAMEYITSEVNSIHYRLNTKKELQFGHLGILSVDDFQNIQFKPAEKAAFLPQNFATTNVTIPTLNSTKETENKTITIQFRPSHFYKYAAVVLILIGLFLNTSKTSDVMLTNSADVSSLSLLNIPQLLSDSVPELGIDSIAINEEIQISENRFHVIVASLKEKEVAESFCKSLIVKKFPQAHVLPPIRTYRVAIQSFADRNEAIHYMENLRATDSRFESAWVLCN